MNGAKNKEEVISQKEEKPKRLPLPALPQRPQNPMYLLPFVLPNQQGQKFPPLLVKPKVEYPKDSNISNGHKRKKNPVNTSQKKKKASRKDKGLRFYSQKVCEKVQQCGVTSYSEVANDLVEESKLENEEEHDEKNIRRRIYDALNVLMALDIIKKDQKKIIWIGVPTNSQLPPDSENLYNQKKILKESIQKKREYLESLRGEEKILDKFQKRNESFFYKNCPQESKLKVPFLIVNTDKETKIDCEMNPEETSVYMKFSSSFQLHDYQEILKKIDEEISVDGESNLDSQSL
eukprot:gene347-6761_t